MHYPTFSTMAISAAFLAAGTYAAPQFPGFNPGGCQGGLTGDFQEYKSDSVRTNVAGQPVVGSMPCPAGGKDRTTSQCHLGTEVSYSTSVTVEVGLELGLDFKKIASVAGISASVAWTTENGVADTTQIDCPPGGDWVCGLIITPSVTEVKGTMHTLNSACQPSPDQPFTIQMPETGPDGLKGALIDVCACKNYEHWADKGAPSVVCPQDCPR